MALMDFVGDLSTLIDGGRARPKLTARPMRARANANSPELLAPLAPGDWTGDSGMGRELAMNNLPMPGPISGFGGGTFNMDGSMATPVDQGRVEQPQPARQPVKRDSVLRRFVGTLGDALLVGSGADPIYGPKKEREAIGEALAQYLGAADPQLADLLRRNPAAAEVALELKAKQQAWRDDELEHASNVENRAMQVLGSVRDQESYSRARNVIGQLYSRFGLNVDDLGLPEVFSPDLVTEIRLRGTLPKDQLADARQNRRLDWDIEDDETDNARADRNTDSLVGAREAGVTERRRYNEQRIATSRRGQDITDRRQRDRPPSRGGTRAARPTATDAKGNKVEWNGQAWVPVR